MKLRRERGNSIIEFSLMAPWLIFMFIGAMDWGFYAYALIATEAASRVGCLYASTSSSTVTDTTSVCTYALDQLRRMPNVGTSTTTCSGSSPVRVSVSAVTGAASADTQSAAQVSVTYVTPLFVPVMMKGGVVVPGQVTITRSVQMRMRG